MDCLELFQFQPFASCVLLALVSVITIFYLLIWKKNKRSRRTDQSNKINNLVEGRKQLAPEPKGAWPIIGHLHLFGPHDLLHQKLGAMADKLGPVFVIKLGMSRVLVVSSWEIAKECFTTNDRIFATRPSLVASKLMGYNHALVGFAPYGTYWREVRKIVTLELLSNHRLHSLKQLRISEIDMAIKELYELWSMKKKEGSGGKYPVPVVVYLNQWFKSLTVNVMVRILAGKRYFGGAATVEDEESLRWKKAVDELNYFLGIFAVSDAFPWLQGVDVQGVERGMKNTGKEMDFLLNRWLEEHRSKKKSRVSMDGTDYKEEQGEEDFIDVMLNIVKDAKISGHEADTVIKSTCMALISAGSDTTTLTLTWAVSLLLNNRHVLEKAQAELDNEIGRHRHVEEEDIKNLPYIQAIVKETLRLYPAAPLSLPHEAMEDCTIGGFHVPKGTRLLTNIWKLQRDPNIWPDPLEFRPERFLSNASHAHIDFRGQHFELIPFGSGRRMCPGVSFAINGVLHLTLARLIHEFELLGTDPSSNAPVDMTEGPGLTLNKATPLDVLIAPRNPQPEIN